MTTIINGSSPSITFSDATTQTSALPAYGASGNILTSTGSAWASSAPAATGGFETGTVLLFYQASAPTGWTQVTTQNNKALRVVSGSGGVAGGTTAFSSVFANQTVTTSVSGTTGATTLSTAQMPSHTHTNLRGDAGFAGGNYVLSNQFYQYNGGGTLTLNQSTGGGGSHDHSFSGSGTSSAVTLDVQYIDIILASKD